MTRPRIYAPGGTGEEIFWAVVGDADRYAVGASWGLKPMQIKRIIDYAGTLNPKELIRLFDEFTGQEHNSSIGRVRPTGKHTHGRYTTVGASAVREWSE